MTSEVQWRIKGDLIGACSCDWGCPCNFNAPPTNGSCQGTYIWHIEEGRYGEVVLDGFYMSLVAQFPGPVHEWHGTTQSIVDARANEQQREALLTLLKGEAEGLFTIFAIVTETALDPIFATFEASMNGLDSRVNVPGILEVGLTTMKNPVTGGPEEVKLVKPTGFTSKESDLGTSTVYRITGGFQHDHSGKYGEYAPFDYSGP